jgi:coenzyme F420-reducing hydrogenase beta subunit
MDMDDEGFRFPMIIRNICKECGNCVNVCPVLKKEQIEFREPPVAYVSWNKDQNIRKFSSSGGLFFPLAQKIIEKGGIVFGAVFDNENQVKHRMAETVEECRHFSGSKYVQSSINNSYRDVKNQLLENKPVLFSGTPCQIAGLRSYLKKNFEKLITVDFSCHGVPSPGVFQDYLEWQEARNRSNINQIKFREKRKKTAYGLLLKFDSGKEYWSEVKHDIFYNGFLSDILLRRSCYQCEFAVIPRQSDITLGDFHGIEKIDPDYIGQEGKGVSIILSNTDNGKKLLDSIRDQVVIEEKKFSDANKYNRLNNRPYEKPIIREEFFRIYKQKGFIKARKVISIPLRRRIGKFLGSKITNWIKNIVRF